MKRAVTTYHERRERPDHSMGDTTVRYEIEGYYYPGSPGSRDEPPDPGDFEVEAVHRLDNRDEIVDTLDVDAAPFTKKEWDEIIMRLEEVGSEADYDEDPPDDDY
jgi:hypothetical protein